MTVIKTYRRNEDGVLHYRWTWQDARGAWSHEDKVGSKSKINYKSFRNKTWPTNPTKTEYFAQFREKAAADGFAELADDDYGWVVLQCTLSSADLSDPEDARLFNEVHEAVDEHLGVRGIGHVDGYDLGDQLDGSEATVFNLFCRVADTAVGVKALRAFAREFPVTQPFVIGSREPGDDSEYVLAWSPSKKKSAFVL